MKIETECRTKWASRTKSKVHECKMQRVQTWEKMIAIFSLPFEDFNRPCLKMCMLYGWGRNNWQGEKQVKMRRRLAVHSTAKALLFI